MLPTRGIYVAFSKNVLGRTHDEARRFTYARDSNVSEKILHLDMRCSGMNNPRVHYLPAETLDLYRWCGNCAKYGENVELPSYCPCCDQELSHPGVEGVNMIRYARHVHSGPVNHNMPITRASTCDEKYQRRVIASMREFLQSNEILRMAGSAGRGVLVGNWAIRMLRMNPYIRDCFQ